MLSSSTEHSGRRVVSRLLWATGLCRALSIPLQRGIRIRFFPTSLSASLWVDQRAHREDEEFILGQLGPGDTFVDVGANVGHLPLLASQAVGPSGSVIAIEPHSRTFEFLRQNVDLNNFRNVRLINAAVGSAMGETFISDIHADDMNHVAIRQREGIATPLITLDSLGICGRVALLKTDTEGFEPFVFEGARELLGRVDCVYFECSEWNLNRYGRTGSELIVTLESLGFEVFKRSGDRETAVGRDHDVRAGGNLVARRAA